MDENINLSLLAEDKIIEQLNAGNMVIVRSKNDFIYILDFNSEFHLFSHTPGSPGGGQKRFPKDEKYTATIRSLGKLADFVYMAEFDKSMNIYGVMCSAEEGILSLFPGDDRNSDSDIEFVIRDAEKQQDENTPI